MTATSGRKSGARAKRTGSAEGSGKTAQGAVSKTSNSKTPKSPKPGAKKSSKGRAPGRVQERRDGPTPVSAKASQAAARKAKGSGGRTVFQRDAPVPIEVGAAKLLKGLKRQEFDFHPSEGKGHFDGDKFAAIFDAEIEHEVNRPAELVHDRTAKWRCQCCDAIIPVPRRTTVYHGDYVLEHDDVLGLLVNGERWVPKAETPIEVVQPGRLKNPWTGELLKDAKRSV